MKSQNHNQLLIKKMSKNILLILLFPLVTFAQVGVNTTAPKAALDVESTNNGVLIPRVQLTSILDNTTIINPNAGPLVTSTLVYNMAPAGIAPNNVIAGFYYWNNSTSRWIAISATSGWELDGNTAITSPAVPATYGTSMIGATENYIGTTDANDVTIGTNAIERMRVKNTTGNIGIGTANPTEKVHVFTNSDANKSSIYSEARQISTGTDYENIAIKGYGRAMPSWGFGNGVMGIGDRANSYFATGVYGHLGSTAPVLPSSNQAIFANGNGEANAGTVYGLFSQATGTAGTRIGGYFTATGGLNNYGLVVPNGGGNVGIGTITPNLARFQVDGMTGNTTALFRGNSTTSQGISMVADWPGIYFNSYYNGAIRSMAGSGFTSIINTDQSTGGLVFQTTNVANPASGTAIASVPVRMTIAGNGNVGIGTPSPSNLLHITSATSGAVRIVDGTQANGRVLTSNIFGVATWQEIGINNVVGTAGFGGITIPTTQTSGFLNTSKTITLPPGRWVVNVTMLLSVYQTAVTPPTPNNSSFWLRTCFADPTTLGTLTRTMDTEGSYYVSGNLPGTSMFSLMSGSVIINNSTGANRTYTYLAGEVLTYNTSISLRTFTGWGEDSIVAYRLN